MYIDYPSLFRKTGMLIMKGLQEVNQSDNPMASDGCINDLYPIKFLPQILALKNRQKFRANLSITLSR